MGGDAARTLVTTHQESLLSYRALLNILVDDRAAAPPIPTFPRKGFIEHVRSAAHPIGDCAAIKPL
jgi:hypothetical protein